MLPPTRVIAPLAPRQTTSAAPSTGSGSSSSDEFLKLIASPFAAAFDANSVISSIAFSLSFALLLVIAFSLIRPYHNVVYAPRAKYADNKHAPHPVKQGLFGWARTILGVREPELVEKLGLDAALFMRFVRMMRNIFTILTIIGCGFLIPTGLVSGGGRNDAGGLGRLTPQALSYSNPDVFWVYIVVIWLFNIVVCFFVWRNYGAVLRLRRQYFEGDEYQKSLHSRTLLLTDIPRDMRSDDGIVRLTEQLQATSDPPRAAIARNVKDLPELMEEHEEAVRSLEKVLAKYLKNPNKLPDKRPTCSVSKNDKAYSKGHKVDAIEYLTARIKELEHEIHEVRESVDNRNAMSYGFASYASISDAHTVAYASRKKGPQGTIMRLAPKPNDLIWKNLPMAKKQRDWQNFINNLWVALLTLVYVVPNVLISVFLTKLSNLGLVWPAFQRSLEAYSGWWSVVQGILSPAITTLVFIFLPKLFRLLVTKAGDVTRTSRERHVMHKLFSFFLFNNLIVFSVFSSLWTFIATIITSTGTTGSNTWQDIEQSRPVRNLIYSLISLSPYWMTWLLQRNLGSAIDLSQLVTLFWGSFQRRFMSPTPRELIELSAPQPFEYPNYYNYFLFYAAVTLSFGTLQPLVLPITALYFWMDSFSKKYILLYIFITKYESGGMFWRSVINRLLVGMMLANIVVALMIIALPENWVMLGVMAPLPFLLLGFKIYCVRTFDDPIHYYNKGNLSSDAERIANENKRRKGERIGVRFGNPLLYRPLMTPMVSAKSQHLLRQVYSGRTSFDDSRTLAAGYSDVYMDSMDRNKPGKASAGADPNKSTAPFEFVSENQLDYEHWKHDANFAHEGGGDGQLYGSAADITRPSTPGSMMSGVARTRTWESDYSRARSESPYTGHGRVPSDQAAGADVGVEYPKGYHVASNSFGGAAVRDSSPARSEYSVHDRSGSLGGNYRDQSRENLVSGAAGMGRSQPVGAGRSGTPPRRAVGQGNRMSGHYAQSSLGNGSDRGGDASAAPFLHGPPGGYGMLRMTAMTPGEESTGGFMTPGEDDGGEDTTSYDYFRRGRRG